MAADDELSQIVRRRLQSLLAEIPPRRSAGDESTVRAGRTTRPGRRAGVGDGPPDGSAGGDDLESPPPAARLAWPVSGLVPRARQFVKEHLVVVGIIVLTGVLWGGYSLFQARTTPVAMAAIPGR